jgi:membrane protease subunit (stomatin/prohibitin family)
MLQHISDAVAGSGTPFLDLAANQVEFAAALKEATAPAFAALGLELLSVTMQNVSLPEELQKILDQRIGMGIIGQNMGQFMQYQAAQALPEMAKGAAGGGSGIAGEAIGLGAGVALGQTLAQTLGQGLAGVGAAAPAPAASKPEDIVSLLEKLGDLKAKGILTDEEFAAKKADLLKKLG